MAQLIQIKRGLKVDLPILQEGELGFCTDTLEIFVGTASGVNAATISVYVHPTTHPASMIDESASRVFLSAQEKNDLLTYPESYLHIQSVSNDTWEITHNLHRYPNITVIDSGGSVVIGNIDYISTDMVRLQFTAEFGGKAYLS